MKKIFGIMAATSAGVVGKEGTVPWNYPEDLNFFRERTRGQVVILGRKTLESIPAEVQKLFHAKRASIVLSVFPI